MKLKKRLKIMKQALNMELREHKSSFIVYVVLRALVILALVRQLMNQNYDNAFLCLLTLVLLVVPSLIQIQLKIELPTGLEIILLLFIFSAEILGEIHAYYIKIPFWDTVLHTLNGFLMAAIGFSLVDLLNRHGRDRDFHLSPFYLALMAFCFSMTIGVIWEFFEFGMDQFFHLDMQKDRVIQEFSSVMLDPTGGNHPVHITGITAVTVNGTDLRLGGYLDIGLIDTMKDLWVNFIGAVIFSIIGYFYFKNSQTGRFAGTLIPTVKLPEADFLEQAKDMIEETLERRIFSMTQNTQKTAPAKRWRGILFDLDGTLMDTAEGILASIRYTTETLGYEPLSEDVMRTFIGPPVRNSLQRTYHLSDEEADKANEVFRNRYKDHDVLLASAYDGIENLLKELKNQGYLIGVATLKREDYAKKLLDHYHISDYCDTICGGDFEGKFLKADVLNLCLERLGLTREEAVLVGDTASDGNGARIVGTDFIAVTFGFGPDSAEKWAEFNPVFVADSAKEIGTFLGL